MECLHPVRLGKFVGRKADGSAIVLGVTKEVPPDVLFDYDLCARSVYLYAPCGKCPLCLKRKKRDMSLRLSHEARVSDSGCFITLTYDDSHLPAGSELCKRDLQLFFKRLRHHTPSIRYFAVGEYGTLKGRPHYHIIIFGWFPPDAYDFEWRGSYMIYRSPLVESMWPFGFSTIGDVNTGVARYCAQYVQKKLYTRSDRKNKEFYLQSKKNGGIGSPYCSRFWRDFYSLGSCVDVNSYGVFKVPIPQYYLHWLRRNHPVEWLDLVKRRQEFASSLVSLTKEDLISKASAEIHRQKNKTKERRLDNE